ncbi:O-antigen ligase family protein [Heyndrickxia ginsengihumi]|uniref:O-antigen ligase family protein n=1 Tax=Heyndrickxia ginsengihumi TaxID=363870 RepID=UPI003D207222
MVKSEMKVSPYDLFVKLICLYGVISFLYTFFSRIYASYIVGFSFLLIIGYIYLKTLKRKDITIILFLFLTIFSTLVNSGISSANLQHNMYFSFSILLINKLCEYSFRKKLVFSFKKNEKLILVTVITLSFISLLSFFIPNCYSGYVYSGFAANFHSVGINMGYLALLIILYLYNKEFKLVYLLWFVIPLIGVVESTARISLVTIILIIYIYYQLKLKGRNLKYLLIPILFYGVFKLFINSSSYEKFILAANDQYISTNRLEAVTSGRLTWWKIDIDTFLNFDFFNKLFGVGNDFVYYINKTQYGLDIWAHNDFIQLLLATGFVGLSGYVIIISYLYITLFKIRKKIPVKLMPEIVLVFIASIAMFNGYYLGTQNSICLILMLVISSYNAKWKEERKNAQYV